MANLQHRLAALWFADIVGFSQLSHEDEGAALEVVQLFQGIARDTVNRYGGHVVKFVGDGALAEFHSTEAAVRAACRLRNFFAEQTKDNGFGEQDLHIGVHIGEIATTPDGDVYGDGVNATARIMNQAEPGQILTSNDVWNQLRQRKEFQFEELGERDLRGAGQHVLHCVDIEDETSAEWPEVGEEPPASKLGTLYDELKRRRVFRVAAGYAVVAWLVTQIADVTVPALFLPAWITRAVIVFAMLGFPIAIAIAWAYDITREGLKRTPPRGAAETLEVRFPLLQRLAAGLLIAAVLAGGWVGWNRWSLGPPTISASTVAILPFNVRGGKTLDYLSDGMASLIAKKMGGVEEYQSADANAVLKFVQRIGAESTDPRSGQVVAEQFGAGIFVLGDIVEAGDLLHIGVSIYESGKQDPVAQITVQGNIANLTVLVDQLVGLMLAAQFGESKTRSRSLAAMTTDSLDALKAYLDGEREFRAGQFDRAAEAFQHAVSIDRRFALAHYRLGMAASWIPNYGVLEQAIEDAVENSDRLSPPDRTLVDALYALKTNQPDKVRTLVRPYLETHPKDVDALYIYGEALFLYNGLRGRPVTEAKEFFERVVELDPDLVNVVAKRLIAIAATEQDFTTVDSLLSRVDPNTVLAFQWGAVRAFAVGSRQEQARVLGELREAADAPLLGTVYRLAGYSPGTRGAEQAARLLLDPERPPYYHRFGRMFLFTISLQRGRWEAAGAHADSLKLIDPARAARAYEFEGLYAATPFLVVPENELRAIRDDIIQWDPAQVTDWTEGAQPLGFHPLYRQYLIGLLSVRLDDKPSISRAINELRRWEADSADIKNLGLHLAQRLEAHMARTEGRAGEALAALSEPPPELPSGEVDNSPVLSQPYELLVRTELFHELGQIEEAKAWYEVLSEGVNWFNHPLAPIAHLRLAQMHDQVQETQEAAYHYSRFVEYWNECDDRLQPLVDNA
jgi:tetratricopeptide (TPR) repeat protein